MSRIHDSPMQTPGQGSQFKVMGFTLKFRVCSYLLNHLNGIIKLQSKVTLSELVCRTHDSVMQTQSQGHTLRSWNSVAGRWLSFRLLFCYHWKITTTLFSETLHYSRNKKSFSRVLIGNTRSNMNFTRFFSMANKVPFFRHLDHFNGYIITYHI